MLFTGISPADKELELPFISKDFTLMENIGKEIQVALK